MGEKQRLAGIGDQRWSPDGRRCFACQGEGGEGEKITLEVCLPYKISGTTMEKSIDKKLSETLWQDKKSLSFT